jgi:glycerophosphoryl diester phosphodiesterase
VARPTHPFVVGSLPLAFAHRGGAAESAENSPLAFQHAVDLGFRWIETDVRSTIDGHAVVFHDATLDRTTDATGELSAMPLAQVRSARMSDGAAPITLGEALQRWPEVRFNVDVKSDAAIAPFLRAVADADAWDRVGAAAFSTARLRTLRQQAGPRLATSMGPSEVARLVLGAPDRSPACAAQVPLNARGIPIATRRFVERAHSRGVQVHVWTIDDPVEMEALLDLGVDGLVTDRPTQLRDVLLRRGSWPQA